MFTLDGKVAFITGGLSGIGLGIAKALAERGSRVIVTYCRDAELQNLDTLPASVRPSIHAVPLDVSERDACRRAALSAERTHGRVHILCNSAGVNLMGPMDEATAEDWDWIFAVNVGGVINTLTSFLPLIKRHGEGGHVINIGSMASFITGPAAGIYTASKFAVRGISECLQYTLAPHRIGVSLVAPGLTRSKIYEAATYRQARFANSAFIADDEQTLKRWEALYQNGMDPDEVGRRAVQGVLNGDFYVFTHPEFRDELDEDHSELLAAFRNEEPDPRRLPIEARRRNAKAEGKRAIAAVHGRVRQVV